MGSVPATQYTTTESVEPSRPSRPATESSSTMTRAKEARPCIKLRDMDEKNMHNLFLKNMAGLIEETKNPSPCLNPNSKRGGMATHAGVALELGISRPHGSGAKMMSPQMEAILIWCQCRTREYDNVKIENFTNSWASGLAFCALIHHFFPPVIRLFPPECRQPKGKLRTGFPDRREICRHSRLSHSRGHGRNGGR